MKTPRLCLFAVFALLLLAYPVYAPICFSSDYHMYFEFHKGGEKLDSGTIKTEVYSNHSEANASITSCLPGNHCTMSYGCYITVPEHLRFRFTDIATGTQYLSDVIARNGTNDAYYNVVLNEDGTASLSATNPPLLPQINIDWGAVCGVLYLFAMVLIGVFALFYWAMAQIVNLFFRNMGIIVVVVLTLSAAALVAILLRVKTRHKKKPEIRKHRLKGRGG